MYTYISAYDATLAVAQTKTYRKHSESKSHAIIPNKEMRIYTKKKSLYILILCANESTAMNLYVTKTKPKQKTSKKKKHGRKLFDENCACIQSERIIF